MASAFQTALLDMVEYTDFIATFADETRQIVAIEPYSYTVDGQVLAAPITQTASQVFVTPMDGDADFVLTYMAGFGRAAGSQLLQVNAAMMIQIVNLSDARSFFNGPMPMAAIGGAGGFPFLPVSPRVIKARSKLQITAISAQAQSFTGFFWAYHGARIWYAS